MSIQFPEKALFSNTILDDVAFGPINMGLSRERARERALEAISAVGLDEELLNRHPRTLSHGQRRLASLAGVIAVKPRFLFLDEPTAGLDSKGKEHIAGILADINEGGTGIIVASHDLHHLLGRCGRLIVLDRGRIAIDGRPGELVYAENVESLGLTLPCSLLAARWLGSRGIPAPWNVDPEVVSEQIRRIRDEAARPD